MSIGTQQLLNNYYASRGLQKQAGIFGTIWGGVKAGGRGTAKAAKFVDNAVRSGVAKGGKATIGRIPFIAGFAAKHPTLTHAAERTLGYGGLAALLGGGYALGNNMYDARQADKALNSYIGGGAGALLGGGSMAALAYALAPEKSKRLAAAVAGLVGAGVGGTAGYMYGDQAIEGAKNLIG